MKVKVGDTVKVIAGADKGKTGKVIKTLKTGARVVVEGVHIVKKHSKPTSMNDKGGIFEIEAPIHVSNVKYPVGFLDFLMCEHISYNHLFFNAELYADLFPNLNSEKVLYFKASFLQLP